MSHQNPKEERDASFSVSISCCNALPRRLAAEGAGTVFVTDNALTTLMCAPRSVYSWDLIIAKEAGKIWIDRRDQEGACSVCALCDDAIPIRRCFAYTG